MNRDRAVQFVLNELAAGRSAEDTAQTLAEMTPLDAAKARRFVELTIEAHNGGGQQAASANKQQLTAYILKHMGRHKDMNSIVAYVAQEGHMSWPQAKAFIRKTLAENKRGVAQRQLAVLLPLAIFTCLVGLAITLLFAGAAYRVAVGDTAISDLGTGRAIRLVLQGPGLFLAGIFMTIGGARSIWRQLKTATVG